MKYSKIGFTLVELLIAVTLSAILMTSVIVFTGSTISNSSKNEKILANFNKNSNFEDKLLESLNNIDSRGIINSGSSFGTYLTGIFLSTKGPNLPITFIGLKSFTGYCNSYSGTANATGTINKLAIKEFLLLNSHTGTTNYYINPQDNTIRKKSDNSIIIGTGYKGSNIDINGLITELNNPSAIVENGSNLYIADRGNNRILLYSGTTLITELVSQKDGINNPTDIYYSGGLYIANADNGNIIKISNQTGNPGTFSGTFQLTSAINIDKINFSFSGISNITSPTSSGSFTFSGITKGIEDIISTGSKLSYYFSGTTINFSTNTKYGIAINNILPNSLTSSSYVKIDFLSGTELKNSINLPYNTNGNVIEILTGGLNYVNNITSTSSWDEDINDFDNQINNPLSREIISELPIKDFSYNLSGNILNLKVRYYKYYDCINEKHIIKEKIYKKYIQ